MVGSAALDHLVCAPLTGPGAHRAAEQLAAAVAAGVDAVEVRLDLIGPEGLEVLGRACGLRRLGGDERLVVIATCRGGDAATHLAMAAAGPDYIDVDLADAGAVLPALAAEAAVLVPAAPALVAAAPMLVAAAPALIVSHHDWEGTPSIEELRVVHRRCVEAGASVVKIVTTALSTLDALTVMRLLEGEGAGGPGDSSGEDSSAASLLPTVAFAMGEHGRFSRVLAPALGSFISYVAVDADSASAPGQLSVSQAAMLRGIAGRAAGAGAGTGGTSAADSTTSDPQALYAVIGNPIAHSLSPRMHNAAYDALGLPHVYAPILVEDLASFLHEAPAAMPRPLRGLSVTIPHKETLYGWLEHRRAANPDMVTIDADAVAIGAVNTLTIVSEGSVSEPDFQRAAEPRGIRYRGSNTDWVGIVRSLEELVSGDAGNDAPEPNPLVGMSALVVGAGGTARAAAYGLMRAGAFVTVVNRTESRAIELAEVLGCRVESMALLQPDAPGDAGGALGDEEPRELQPIADILVNATSVGLEPGTDEMPVPESVLPRFRYVLDVVYSTSGTPLVRTARAVGLPAVGGEAVLLHQGAAQFALWFDREAPVHVMGAALQPPQFRVPGSKSITQRALICAALAGGTSTVSGALLSEDTHHLMGALRAMGVRLGVDGTDVTVAGVAGQFARASEPTPEAASEPTSELTPEPASEPIWLGNNGTAMRLLTALASLGTGEYRFDGTPRLRERPIGPVVDALRALGAGVVYEGTEGHLPITVAGGSPEGGRVTFGALDSSQYISALMLAAPYFARGVDIELSEPVVSAPYIEITASVMRAFGAKVTMSPDRITVEPGGYQPHAFSVEPDASSASYPVAAALISGRSVHIPQLPQQSIQGDAGFLTIAEQLGATVTWSDEGVTVTGTTLPTGPLTFDMGDMPDVVPTLAVACAFREGTTDIVNVAHLRVKESDRIAAVVTELTHMGCEAEELADGIRVIGKAGAGLTPASIQTYDDHRIAMSFALAGLRVPGMHIANPECVAKSFANYWDEAAKFGVTPDARFRRVPPQSRPSHIVLVGYRATGKSAVGAELARQLGARFADSDTEVIASHGSSITEIVERAGWDAFRRAEAQVLEAALEAASDTQAPLVLATGGGALTDQRSHVALSALHSEGALTVWLSASAATIADRIAGDSQSTQSRPPLTQAAAEDATASGAASLAEIEAVLAARAPLYEQYADVTINTDGKSIDEVASEILDAIEARAKRGAPLVPQGQED